MKRRWNYTGTGGAVAAVLLCIMLCLGGCGRRSSSTPAPVEIASEDASIAASTSKPAEEAVPEEPIKVTADTALVGICLARSEEGDNERLQKELISSLVSRGFQEDNLFVKDLTSRKSKQSEEIEECLESGCELLIISAAADSEIPEIVDRAMENEARVVFVNCEPAEEEIQRWEQEDLPCVWIGSTYRQELACQMSILYDYSGAERGPDFNEDGYIGAVLVGGNEETADVLEETASDLGLELRILDETDSGDFDEISAFIQETLNAYRKEAELVLCSTDAYAQAAADGVQLRHRLVGRDILVIGTGAHEDTCTAIINKLMSGSVFTDFYEQANLISVAAKDLIDGNQAGHQVENVIFKVTEDNAQEVLDQLWRTREDGD